MSRANRAVEIIAEIANAHQGDPKLAAQLVDAGFDGGADAVKFQVYFANELLVRSHPRFEHFQKQSFDSRVWRDLILTAKARGNIFCDVFGIRAVELANSCGVDGFKIHSSDTENIPLLEAVASTGKRIILSAGGTTVRELQRALEIIGKCTTRPVILHGFQSYPTELEDSAFERLDSLVENFGQDCDIGYMDHVAGDDDFALFLPLLAIGAGARVIEKHITFDREKKGVDYYSSVNPDVFEQLVKTIRRAETVWGSNTQAFSSSERHYRNTVKKHWVATRALEAGHVLTTDDLVMKRVPESNSNAVSMEKLVGRILNKDVAEEHPFTRGDLQQTVWALPVARWASTRLPGKASLDVAGMPTLGHLFERLKLIERIDQIVFCTTTQSDDDALVNIALAHGIESHRGPVNDVLARMLGAIEEKSVDVVVRVTGDDILIDAEYVERAVAHHLKTNAEYTDVKGLPSGTEVEVFDADLLHTIADTAIDSGGTEYLTCYVTNNRDQFRISKLPVDPEHMRDWRLTLDTPEDYEVIRLLLEAMRIQKKSLNYTLQDIVDFFEANPDILKINAEIRQRQTPPEVNTRLAWNKNQ